MRQKMDQTPKAVQVPDNDLWALRHALSVEGGAARFYAQAAKLTTSPSGRDAFLYLAEQEQRHPPARRVQPQAGSDHPTFRRVLAMARWSSLMRASRESSSVDGAAWR